MDSTTNKEKPKTEEQKTKHKHRKLLIWGIIVVLCGVIALAIARTIEEPDWISGDQSNVFGSDSINQQYQEINKLDFNESDFTNDISYFQAGNEERTILGETPRLFHWDTLNSGISINNIDKYKDIKVVMYFSSIHFVNSNTSNGDNFLQESFDSHNKLVKNSSFSIYPNENFSNNLFSFEVVDALVISIIKVTFLNYITIDKNSYYFSLSSLHIFAK